MPNFSRKKIVSYSQNANLFDPDMVEDLKSQIEKKQKESFSYLGTYLRRPEEPKTNSSQIHTKQEIEIISDNVIIDLRGASDPNDLPKWWGQSQLSRQWWTNRTNSPYDFYMKNSEAGSSVDVMGKKKSPMR